MPLFKIRDLINNTVEELNEMLDIIIESAKSLNNSTEELSKFIHKKLKA